MIDHSEHIDFMQRVIEQFRVEAWRMYEADKRFCHVCAFIGYRTIQTIAMKMLLEEDALPDDDRQDIVSQLAVLATLPMPSHDEQPRPSQ